MTPLDHPNISAHVLTCRTCLDKAQRDRDRRRLEYAARLAAQIPHDDYENSDRFEGDVIAWLVGTDGDWQTAVDRYRQTGTYDVNLAEYLEDQ